MHSFEAKSSRLFFLEMLIFTVILCSKSKSKTIQLPTSSAIKKKMSKREDPCLSTSALGIPSRESSHHPGLRKSLHMMERPQSGGSSKNSIYRKLLQIWQKIAGPLDGRLIVFKRGTAWETFANFCMCRASKQYAFMYEDSNLDRAWTDPDVYNTRSRGGRARDSRSDSKG